MSAEEEKIKVEVQRLMDLAKRIALDAQKLNQVVGTDYAASITELQKYWGGDNEAAILAISKKISEGYAETIKGLIDAAKALESTAQEYLKAEMKAKAGK